MKAIWGQSRTNEQLSRALLLRYDVRKKMSKTDLTSQWQRRLDQRLQQDGYEVKESELQETQETIDGETLMHMTN